MEDRLRQLEKAVAEIQERLQRLEDRLESRPEEFETALGANAAERDDGPKSPGEPGGARAILARSLQLIGRTCLVLGGAFLIRALSDSRILSLGVGIALALMLALGSLAFAYRAGRSGKKLSAAFHGLTSALIAYPLAYETSTRLGAMSLSSAASVIAGITLLLFFVAWRDHVQALAWLGVAFCLATSLAVIQAAGLHTEWLLVLTLVAAATMWIAESRSWNGPRWPAVLLLDAVVLRSVLSAAHDSGAEPGALRVGVAFAIVVVLFTLSALVHRTFARNQSVTAFHIVQSFVGFGLGAVAVVYASGGYGWRAALAGAVILILSGAAMFVALSSVPSRNLARKDYLFYLATSAGLLFVSGALIARSELRGLLWAALALLAAGLGRRLKRLSLSAYGALFIWAGATASSLMNIVSDAFLGGAQRWTPPNAESVVVLALALTTYWVIAKMPSESTMRPWMARFPASATLFLCAISLAALVVHGERAVLGLRGSDHAFVAMARSLALIATATSLALAHRRLQWSELAWIAYVILALGGIKLLVEDLPTGRALTLLIAFATYGIGLIAIQQLLRPLREVSYQTGAPLNSTRRP
jgi:hypothetical protein